MPYQSTESNYIHGFSSSERPRLVEQADVLAPAVFEGLELGNCETLLELGCGVGAQTRQLLQRWPQLRIHAIDYNPIYLQSAEDYLNKEIAKGHVFITEANSETLPFDDDCFDVALTIWMLAHVQSPDRILAEARRVLRPGGRILLTEVDNSTFGFSPPNAVIEGWWQKFNACQQRGGSDPYIGQSLERIAKDTGFKDIKADVLDIVSSSREPERRMILLHYLCDLLLSGAQSMKKYGYITDADKMELKQEFAMLESQPETNFLYQAIRLSALKPCAAHSE
jgi:ubiquinone/menaquinone biosynthesis C-methylase UbiE